MLSLIALAILWSTMRVLVIVVYMGSLVANPFLDIKYIEERSFSTDWKIIHKTFGAVLEMSGE